MITKEQWSKLRKGSILRYKHCETWVLRTVLLGPADGIPSTKRSSGGVTLIKWNHSRFDNPTTTYFWSDLKDKVEWTGCRIKSERATYPEMQRIKEMFGEKAMKLVERRLNETKKSWERIRKWQEARICHSVGPRIASNHPPGT